MNQPDSTENETIVLSALVAILLWTAAWLTVTMGAQGWQAILRVPVA